MILQPLRSQVGSLTCLSSTEKGALLQSMPRVMASRPVCSNSLYIAAPSNTSSEKISDRQPQNTGLDGSTVVHSAESGLGYSPDMVCELNPTLRNRGSAQADARGITQPSSLAKAESGPSETFLAGIFKTF